MDDLVKATLAHPEHQIWQDDHQTWLYSRRVYGIRYNLSGEAIQYTTMVYVAWSPDDFLHRVNG